MSPICFFNVHAKFVFLTYQVLSNLIVKTINGIILWREGTLTPQNKPMRNRSLYINFDTTRYPMMYSQIGTSQACSKTQS